ncbi:Uma2 family endonuclease [Nonomuraea sp. CA-218870]|uniref:Uma2 family endonuclease n=1 Tax=Nonomuraea sp. CA-218870 TaxID=3239998 RepID=UPI003D8BAA71
MIVSPMGSPEHGWIAADLHDALLPLRREHGWRGSVGSVNVCIEGPRDSCAPDYTLAAPDCPRRGQLELLSSGVLMVAEVVSPGSAHIDRHEKPRVYATGRVPVYLLIDPIGDEPGVTVLSKPADGAYAMTTRVTMGSPITLPAPIGFELDTSIFKG